ncbi:hypothetical protein CROQUDRAFT_666294 [Cronartium quercuum f. sp. fusiforme G11]|uniref:Uncharacterized protein n=1 Tax=Cronartium quercuum f. sp. fusiforme G11 TaxID=708437 RepID=A0A9P6N887_9BASI|nr:hypothetical protein CROQUDRAFT_666294 [Cronartium quercuum f. sp. fusiforme G11]
MDRRQLNSTPFKLFQADSTQPPSQIDLHSFHLTTYIILFNHSESRFHHAESSFSTVHPSQFNRFNLSESNSTLGPNQVYKPSESNRASHLIFITSSLMLY